ncbi:single-stranded DNA-binding protein [Agromyces larvae]|uniref:Single-stranded DNA-binding protein n=1 Tax=Agromyces larvae TaxID=2929802 RepID=A0ABY4C581_9MICO|nr:single-stranded DNA-binding protein [Agromyces larvae]UOE45316.1 single-stranded DNA-binding protein [Agromyces larvae]
MTDQITITGIVGSDPRPYQTNQGLAITSFRLASTRRYFDRVQGAWVDADTNWYTVSSFRNLALNTALSIRKGEHVIVHGRLKQRAWEAGERSGTAVEIEADAIGHDLAWGVTRVRKVAPEAANETSSAAEGELGASGGEPAADAVNGAGSGDEYAVSAPDPEGGFAELGGFAVENGHDIVDDGEHDDPAGFAAELAGSLR